jgi:hypothetical protein
MSMMAGGPPGDSEASARDYSLTHDEIDLLMRELARAFNTEDRALLLLRSMRFPRELVPDWGSSGSLNFWSLIFNDLDNGAVATPYRRLIAAARNIYAQHPTFAALEGRHQETKAAPSPEPAEPEHPADAAEAAADVATLRATQDTAARVSGCHAVVRTPDPRVRETVRIWLESELLEPRLVWSTHEMTSFEVNEADDEQVRVLINGRYAHLLVKVIPPGQPDALIGVLRVFDVDSHELAVPEVPIQLTVAELGAVAARFHPAEASTSIRTVTGRRRAESATHVGDGVTQQVPMDGTLLQWGFGDDHKVTIKSVKYHQIRVVFVGACPRWNGGGRLGEIRVSKELDQIRLKTRLRHITLAGEFPNATREHLAEIMQREPDILHIACHCHDSRLYWEDDDGDAHEVPASWLAGTIAERAGRRLSGIVLSACDGESAGPLFTGAARDVIAHKGPLPDNQAIDFTTRFYDELARMPVLPTAARRAANSVLIFPPNAQGGL